ncbi:MAG: coenzyme F420-0:L-glutamate ligase [Deltaproteobacteria bacterium]|nr:MAG: coenzyme F420-0:L-glutamate ligase [Deltaproteobacteria bacterium]
MKPGEPTSADLHVGSELVVRAIAGVPTIDAGQDLSEVIISGLAGTETELVDGDVMVLASKIVSRAEGCFVDLGGVTPSDTALHLAEEVDKDPRLVELILRESTGVSRKTTGALIVRHRLGFVSANAGIDASNAAPSSAPEGSGPWVLILPRDPDATAARLRAQLARHFSAEVGVIITDSWGRPFRRGTVGFALGVAGVPALWDRSGAVDRHGRVLEATVSALADSIAAAADLVAGQADEGRPLTLVRGLRFAPSDDSAQALLRDFKDDLYA